MPYLYIKFILNAHWYFNIQYVVNALAVSDSVIGLFGEVKNGEILFILSCGNGMSSENENQNDISFLLFSGLFA